jgi:hypothetical protein
MIRKALIAIAVSAPLSLAAQQASQGSGGELRVLDKVSGTVTDIEMQVGSARQVGLLLIRMNACRYPSNNPSGDAYAELTVTYRDNPLPVFSGWMIASAPALNAMDHPRYDVWVLNCRTS